MMKMASASFFSDALIFTVRNALPVPGCFWMNADLIDSICISIEGARSELDGCLIWKYCWINGNGSAREWSKSFLLWSRLDRAGSFVHSLGYSVISMPAFEIGTGALSARIRMSTVTGNCNTALMASWLTKDNLSCRARALRLITRWGLVPPLGCLEIAKLKVEYDQLIRNIVRLVLLYSTYDFGILKIL